MKRIRVVHVIAWIIAVLALAGSVHAWLAAVPRVTAETGSSAPPSPARSETAETDVDSLATVLRDRNPFRLERTPTTVPFGTEPRVDPVPAPPPPPRPSLTLAGLVGGPPWNVLIEGLPGNEAGLLLVAGEESNGIRVEWVGGDTVLLSGSDTTWVLTPRGPWQ